MNMPRPEHPKPQLERKDWINLNGSWEFAIDNAMIGMDQHWESRHFDSRITVPFCPESVLSGVGHTDFMNCVWYRRELFIPDAWKNKRVILHFGAVDYRATVYVNGKKAGTHKGGYTSFSFDITDLLAKGENFVSVCAVDLIRTYKQPRGKQSDQLGSYGCLYTRTTGIWQTVWMEAVSEIYLQKTKYYPDAENGNLQILLTVNRRDPACVCRATAFYEGKEMGFAETVLNAMTPSLSLNLKETHLWEVGQGRLYDLKLEILKNGQVIDCVNSYFGLRHVDLRENAFCLNGKKVFGRWVLDQGFYPDGIYTAPSEEALKKDIELGIQLGFNGARLHEKIFEERYLYWADKLGYLVWGEHANWGLHFPSMTDLNCFLPEWMESVERDFNHPSIIGWCPFNENWAIGEMPQNKEMVETVYHITKAMDPTRPVIDTSGNYHTVTDIFDVHDYKQDPVAFAKNYERINEGIVNDAVARSDKASWQTYRGEPVFVSEYGGIGWDESAHANASDGYTEGTQVAWGYGVPKTEAEFIERYRGLTEALLNNPYVMGFCYTQLYDVEQEINGLLTYERKFKFDPNIFKAINEQKAAIED